MFKYCKWLILHLSVPHALNDWKPKYLHNDFLASLIAFVVAINILFKYSIGIIPNTVLGVRTNISVNKLLEDTNLERTKQNLPPLMLNTELMEAAKAKAQHMFKYNYWAHYAPDGTSPWYFFEKSNYQYDSAGENLAKDFTTSEMVVRAWMDSAKHRENLLNPDYQEIGFAISEGYLQGQPTTLVVQLFAKPEHELFVETTTTEKTVAAKNNNLDTLAASQTIEKKPLIDARTAQKQLVIAILIGLLIVLGLDFYAMEHWSLIRISGKHVAHISFAVFLLGGILLARQGFIL